ncbi:MAG: AI-2E family transporter [Defluviitaleaceae bacterium]|nr:AI-2E family transporter [Defluviitaleaceae bacterium]
MDSQFRKKNFKKLFPIYLLALAIILTIFAVLQIGVVFDAVAWVWGVASPFLWGFIIAYIVNIPISSIQKLLAKSKNKVILKKQKLFSVLITLVLLLGIIAAFLSFVIPAIINSIEFFSENWHIYWDAILGLVDRFNEWDLFGWQINEETIFGILEGLFADFSFDILLQPISIIMDAGGAVINGIITFVASIYILVEKDKFKKYLRNVSDVFVSKTASGVVSATFSRLNHNFRQYVRTQTIDGLILGSVSAIALAVMGSPFALILGIMLGIFNYVPIFGSIVATVIAVLVVMLTQGLTMGLIAALVLFVIQQVDANVIQPRLMSGSFALSPLLVIIGIVFGGAIAGIFGMIVAIPVVAVLKDIVDSIVEYHRLKKFGEPVPEANENETDKYSNLS